MPKTHDIAAVVGEKKDGSPRWQRCGSLIQTDKGLRIKLDVYPAGGDGWFACFEPRQQQPQQPAQPQPTPQQQSQNFQQPQDSFDSDIPF